MNKANINYVLQANNIKLSVISDILNNLHKSVILRFVESMIRVI